LCIRTDVFYQHLENLLVAALAVQFGTEFLRADVAQQQAQVRDLFHAGDTGAEHVDHGPAHRPDQSGTRPIGPGGGRAPPPPPSRAPALGRTRPADGRDRPVHRVGRALEHVHAGLHNGHAGLQQAPDDVGRSADRVIA